LPLTLSRSLLVVLVPGIVACAPWLLLCAEYAPGISNLYLSYQVLGNALLFALIVIVGSVFEGLGSRAEVRWDKEREKEFSVQENWYKYLAQTPKSEPVGHRYMSRAVTTMYFELAMSIAGPSMVLGTTAILIAPKSGCWFWLGSAAGVAIGGAVYWFFRNEARDSHEVLCKVRQELAHRLSDESNNGK
jgi:hypothetical protein